MALLLLDSLTKLPEGISCLVQLQTLNLHYCDRCGDCAP